MASIFKRGGRKGKGGYYVSWYERPGLRRTRYAGTDRAGAEALARKLETDSMLRREGVIDPTADRLAAEEVKPLGEHVRDFVATLAASGATAGHVVKAETHIRRIIEAIGASRFSHLTPSAVQRAVGDLVMGGLSHRTGNAHLTSVKSFARWAWLDGRMRTHLLASLKSYNVEEDRKLVRRALSDVEIGKLLRAAYEGADVLGLSGPDRTMLFATAVGTGLRLNELRTLTSASFALDGTPPTVTVAAGYSKRRRKDVQPLPAGLAAILIPWLSGKPAGRPPWGKLRRGAELLRADLATAGIAEETPEGVCDFHSLRHTYISRLVRSGVNVKLAQSLARHSTPTLTLGVYAHVDTQDKATALAMVPALDAPRFSTALQTAHGPQNVLTDGKMCPTEGQEIEVGASGSGIRKVARIAESPAYNALVPEGGVEPPRPCGYGILNPACLPFHHSGGARQYIRKPGDSQGC